MARCYKPKVAMLVILCNKKSVFWVSVKLFIYINCAKLSDMLF